LVIHQLGVAYELSIGTKIRDLERLEWPWTV